MIASTWKGTVTWYYNSNSLKFEFDPRNLKIKKKKVIEFILQAYHFPSMCGQSSYQLPVLPLIYDLMGNSTQSRNNFE